jgi:hypothetical protein
VRTSVTKNDNDNDKDKRRQIAELRLSMRASSAAAIRKRNGTPEMAMWEYLDREDAQMTEP